MSAINKNWKVNIFKTCVLTWIVISLISCNPPKEEVVKKGYVDDIIYDEQQDLVEFKLCSEDYTIQYFNTTLGLEYEGDKIAIVEEVKKHYNSSIVGKESGLIRIRFLVNCKGETGRFRLIGMDENYNEKKFPKNITDQLMKITKNLKGWKVKTIDGKAYDYYQYLIYKLEEGLIVKILP